MTNAVLILAALAIGTAVVHREFFAHPATASASVPSMRPVKDSQWVDALRVGVSVGDTNAAVTLVEFADLECPACRGFHTSLKSTRAKYGKDLRWVFVHFPLSQHRFALPAARAAECAADQGRFSEFVDIVYQEQDSLGLKGWGALAHTSGISDTAAIAQCAARSTNAPRIDEGRTLGRRMQIAGTPTVFVNGWRFNSTPSAKELDEIISAVRQGKNPPGALDK